MIRFLCASVFVLMLSFSALAAFFHGGPLLHFQTSFGDSITFSLIDGPAFCGLPTTSPANCYANIIAAAESTNIVNFGTSGDQACDMSDGKVFPNTNPGALGSKNPTYTEMIGTNDAGGKGAGAYEAVFNQCWLSAVSWLAVPSTNKVAASACAQTGTWAPVTGPYVAGLALSSSTNGSTLTCPITVGLSGVIYGWYRLTDAAGGTFTYAVDGGSTTSINNQPTPPIATANGGTHGDGLIRITGLSPGGHTVVFTMTNTNPVVLAAIGTPPTPSVSKCCVVLSGGVIMQQNNANSAATSAYNTDVINNIAMLAGDGLNDTFVDTRNAINSTTDMANTLHPNNSGHAKLGAVFEASWSYPQ